MAKKPVIHIETHRSFWFDKLTVLCGQTRKSRRYRTYWFSAVTCPACKRLGRQHKEARKRATKEGRK